MIYEKLDALGSRIWWAVAASAVLNVALWAEVSSLTQRPPSFRMDIIQVSRVDLDKQGRKKEKVVKPQEVKKKKELIHKEIVHRRAHPPKLFKWRPSRRNATRS